MRKINDKKSGILGRREFVKTAGSAAAGLGLAASGLTASAAETKRPNILLILVDQWRERCWFPQDCRIPGIEKLRSQGLSFTNHFTSAVPCSPSRATLFTGLHLPQHGVFFNVGLQRVGADSLDPSFMTLGHHFQQSGYRTPYFGKWHLTEKKDYQEVGLAPYGFEEWQGPDRHGMPREGIKYDSKFADRALQWLEQNGRAKSPWFLTCSFINPHDVMFWPRQSIPHHFVPDIFDRLPDNFDDDLEGKPRAQKIWQTRVGKILKAMDPKMRDRAWLQYLDFYYHVTKMVDMEIARLLEALDRLGLAEDTIVVFVSDHGEMAGSHRLTGKGPFAYHENIQVPLIVRWPGRVPAGTETSALAHTVDFHPTLLDLAGIKATVDHLPGKSLAPVITGNSDLNVNDHILMAWGLGSNLQSDSRVTQHLLDHLSPFKGVPMQVRAIFDGRYKFARYFDPDMEEEYEMYDLVNDPLEMHNLAGDPGYRTVEKEMSEKLREAVAREMAPVPAGRR